ncbi:MAG: CRTAC1 family protein [Alphaproteobacteria bacterium]|nr:CRTAC1 family protein [Alphaproteobacteria bacterium]
MSGRALAVLLVACTPPSDDGGDTQDDTRVAETADTDPVIDTDPPSDSVPDDTAPPGSLRVEVGPERTCAATSGPMRLLDGGQAWRDQPHDPDSTALFVGGGFGVGDLTGDGRLDLIVTRRGPDVQLWVQEGPVDAPVFVDRSGDLPPLPERTAGVSLVDLDDDGDLDAFVTAFQGPDTLLRNDGSGRFEDATAAYGLAGPPQGRSMGSAWADWDRDGDLDVFVGTYGALSSDQGLPDGDPDRLFVQGADTTFADVVPYLPDASVIHPLKLGHTFGGAWTDVDGDGWLELFVVNDFGWRVPTLLLRNVEGRLQLPVPEGLESNAENMGLALGDVDGDGIVDFLVTAWDVVRLYASDDGGPGWSDVGKARGLRPDWDRGQRVAWAADLGDADNDGDLDAVIAFGHLQVRSNHENPLAQPDALFLQGDDGTFTDVAPDWGVDDAGRGRGALWVDLDRDGMLDLVRTDLRGPTRIHLGTCTAGAWLEVELHQPAPNVHAVGARLRFVAGERSWVREVRAGGTGYGTSGPPEVHVGLGAVDRLDRLEITWPDGREDVLQDLEVRRRVRVERR